uniref:Secreted protein n=1 Tax=Parascaris univalens TaxID=6257 RepID=A0A915BBP4_PARUN
MRTGCSSLEFLCENIQHYKSIATLFDDTCTRTVELVGSMKALAIIIAISLFLLASNSVVAGWRWRGPRFSYGRYLDNYYNYFLPAYYSNFGYGKRSVEHNQQPTADAAN